MGSVREELKAALDRAKTPAAPIVRRLVPTPRAADGLYIQPTEVGPKREQVELHNRQRAANHGKYADRHCGDQNTVDLEGKGKTLCWNCNNLEGDKCVLVAVPTLKGMRGPSCAEYENKRAGDFEKWLKVLSIEAASFGDAENGRWGCIVCPYGIEAYAPDSLGNTIYCRVWECRVSAEVGCCRVNGNKERPLPKEWKTDTDPDDPWKK